jgi:hypothetical protein
MDQSTLDLLDWIVENNPDLQSRSAAIRWCARLGAKALEMPSRVKKTKVEIRDFRPVPQFPLPSEPIVPAIPDQSTQEPPGQPGD